MQIKICGMKVAENIEEIGNLQPDFMGFIFYKNSTRFVGDNFSTDVLESIPKAIKKVAVFVNESSEIIETIYKIHRFDFVQLHGDETPGFCQELKAKNIHIIKAFAVHEDFNFTILSNYQNFCDLFLFDTKGEKYGGTGQSFDWNLLQKYDLNKPFFLSGGIGLNNIKFALRFQHPMFYGLDLNSRLETAAGIKSTTITQKIIKTIRKYE